MSAGCPPIHRRLQTDDREETWKISSFSSQAGDAQLEKAVGIKDKLLGCSFVESGIALRGVAERKNGGVYDFCNGQAVMQDGLHELAVVLQHRRLASVEAVRFRPAEAAVARPTGPAPAT